MSNLQKEHIQELEELSSNNSNSEEALSDISFTTKIPKLKKKYYFHELLKESKNTKHYIAEDLDINFETSLQSEEENQEDIFFYLKQTMYNSKQKLLKAKKFYIKLIKYCESSFAKNDIIKYSDVRDYIDEKEGYYELVVISDFGESERIDVENIEKEHINKFLKNVCLLLKDLKKYDFIYHSNISLNNIILDKEELKLSGFKPIFLEIENEENKGNWKWNFAKLYGIDRLDLYLLGLLWLKFLNTNVEEKIKEDFLLENVVKDVDEIVKGLSKEEKMETVSLLLDLKNHLDINLDTVILNFDEYYILENIQKNQIKKEEEKKEKEKIEEEEKKNKKKDNVFITPLSEKAYTLQNDQVFTLKNEQVPNIENLIRDNQNLIRIDGTNFTLQGEEDLVFNNNLSKNNMENQNVKILEIKNAELLKKRETEMRWSTDPSQERFTFKRNKNIHSEKQLMDQIQGLKSIKNEFNLDDEDYDENYLSSKFAGEETIKIEDNQQDEIKIEDNNKKIDSKKLFDKIKTEKKI